MTRNPAGRRLWRTVDGGLVVDGDPAAVTLAYGPDDEVAEADLELAAAIEPEPQPEPEPEVHEDPADGEAIEPEAKPARKKAGHAPKPEE